MFFSIVSSFIGFGTIRNNTALKQHQASDAEIRSFGTIRNNTALKPNLDYKAFSNSFGTIRNNTALKPDDEKVTEGLEFWNHSKQHSSKTLRF